eukprot:m.169570 g.169570  ORF g.169570 m.169570 type:complete len:73 (-) comp18246_c0_seq1:849-1067(-)
MIQECCIVSSEIIVSTPEDGAQNNPSEDPTCRPIPIRNVLTCVWQLNTHQSCVLSCSQLKTVKMYFESFPQR